jgi:protein-disulfide isomerase
MADKNIAQSIATCVLLACAAMVSLSVVHREILFTASSGLGTGQRVENWKDLAHHRTPAMGSVDAPVTILDFSDYECPYCKSLEGKLRLLTEQQPDTIKVIRYEFPMTLIHSNAYQAALAGKCAAKQGVVGPFQVEVYRQSARLSGVDWRELATAIKLADPDAFISCIEKKELSDEVDADLELGQRLGFTGTPMLVINGDVVSGDQTKEALSFLIEKHRKD